MTKNEHKIPVPTIWRKPLSYEKEELKKILKTKEKEKFFSEAFILTLLERIRNLEKNYIKITVFNSLLILALFVNSFVKGGGFSGLGVFDNFVNEAAEIVLFISATLSFISSQIFYGKECVLTFLNIIIEEKFSGMSAKLVKNLYGDFWFSSPFFLNLLEDKENYVPNKLTLGFFAVQALLMFTIVIVFSLAAFAVHIIVILSILKNPSFSDFVSYGVVFYTIIIDLLLIGLVISEYLPLPFKDYSIVEKVIKLQKKSLTPEEYFKEYDKIVSSHKKEKTKLKFFIRF